MASIETTTVSLLQPVSVNGIQYPAGQAVKVPKDQAEDLQRIAWEAQQEINNRMRQPIESTTNMNTGQRTVTNL